MSRASAPALRGTTLGLLLRIWNPVMRRLLESPFHWPLSRWFAVLAWRGRKSGKPYSTPVSLVCEGDVAYVTTGDRWWRNLIDGAPVRMRVAGRWRAGEARLILDPAESQAQHERLFRRHAWFRWLAGIPKGPDGGADPEALRRAVAAGRVLVRIELDA